MALVLIHLHRHQKLGRYSKSEVHTSISDNLLITCHTIFSLLNRKQAVKVPPVSLTEDYKQCTSKVSVVFCPCT
jgi:hypothetical protein